jgi:8-oxo-dGTP pyrophosphatase MutT (NUDIX family)
MTPTPESLATVLAAHARFEFPALPGRTNHLESGVLVPLLFDPEPVCVVTVRAATLRAHAGEVCFPGGRPDVDDRDLRATALREAKEELDIDDAVVLGELSSIPLFTSDYRLYPFVASIAKSPVRKSTEEVAEILHIPLRSQIERSAIDAIPWSHEGQSGLSPAFALDRHVMYGATAHTFYELLCVIAPLFGLEAPPLAPGRFQWSDVLPKTW